MINFMPCPIDKSHLYINQIGHTSNNNKNRQPDGMRREPLSDLIPVQEPLKDIYWPYSPNTPLRDTMWIDLGKVYC